MKLFPLCLCTAFILCLLSCKKDTSNSSQASFNGNYKFISMDASTKSTSEVVTGSDVEKSVTLSHYITKNNTGTVVITSTTMTTSNVAYTIDTTMMMYSYSNGILNDSIQMPFQYTAAPSSSTASYKMVGSDSAFFSSGSMFSSGVVQQTVPLGVKFKTNGSRVNMIMSGTQNSTQSSQGSIVNTRADVYSIVTLEKM